MVMSSLGLLGIVLPIYTYINSLSPWVRPWVIGRSACIVYSGTGRTYSVSHPCARGSNRQWQNRPIRP
jgi:hypothetical protein